MNLRIRLDRRFIDAYTIVKESPLRANWKSVYESCETLSRIGIREPIFDIIYKKRKRPLSLIDQYYLLRNLSCLTSLGPSHRLNALIAAGHKAMEVMSSEFVEDVLAEIEISLDEYREEASASSRIREDGTHVRFSAYSVLFHLYVWRADFVGFKRTTEKAVEEYGNLNFRQLGQGFYQTCTNVTRCIGAAYVCKIIDGKGGKVSYLVDMIFSALYQGVLRSDKSTVKFQEFLRDARIYHAVAAFDYDFPAGDREVNMDVSERLIEIFWFALRPHGHQKCKHLRENMQNFINNSAHEKKTISSNG